MSRTAKAVMWYLAYCLFTVICYVLMTGTAHAGGSMENAAAASFNLAVIVVMSGVILACIALIIVGAALFVKVLRKEWKYRSVL